MVDVDLKKNVLFFVLKKFVHSEISHILTSISTCNKYYFVMFFFQVLTIDVKKDGLINYVRDTAKKTNQADRLEILINVPGDNGNMQ